MVDIGCIRQGGGTKILIRLQRSSGVQQLCTLMKQGWKFYPFLVLL